MKIKNSYYLRRLRGITGLNCIEAADAMGMSRGSLHTYEHIKDNSTHSAISAEAAEKILSFYERVIPDNLSELGLGAKQGGIRSL